jgi:hypothetical protein
MADAVAPIVIVEGRDIEVYPTVAVACLDVEAVDANDGVLEAFDSEGRRLVFQTHGILLSLKAPPDSHPDPAELERRLRSYIQSVGVDRVGITDIQDATLPALLDAVLRFQRGKDRETWKWSLRGILARIGRRRIIGGDRPE